MTPGVRGAGGKLGFDARATSRVVAVSDSPTLRETLAVLLEHDCALQFLQPDGLATADLPIPDLALIASSTSTRLLQQVAHRWPGLPIVAVDLSAGRAAPQHTSPPPLGVRTVPLEPQAIRGAVLRQLSVPLDTDLEALVRVVGELLYVELASPFEALRSFAALHATGAGPDTYAIRGSVLGEQCRVVFEILDQLHTFLARPRRVQMSADFVAVVCRELQQPGPAAPAGVQCTCTSDTAPPQRTGPVTLAPVVARFLGAHLHRRAEGPVARMHFTSRGVTLAYLPQPPVRPLLGSWPLLLASFTLRPWSWQVLPMRTGGEEAVRLEATT